MSTEASKTFNRPFLATTNIVASNDINEESLHSLADQVGYRYKVLVTCFFCGGSGPRLQTRCFPRRAYLALTVCGCLKHLFTIGDKRLF